MPRAGLSCANTRLRSCVQTCITCTLKPHEDGSDEDSDKDSDSDGDGDGDGDNQRGEISTSRLS